VENQQNKSNLDGALFVDEVEDFDHLDGGNVATRGKAGDGKAERSAELVQDLLRHMSLEARVIIREDGERVVLDLDGEDAGRAIGKKGQTLDALQFLTNKIVNRFPEGRRHIVLDSGDYRDRHDEGLVSLAKREAKRAVQIGRTVTLAPMPPRDRRVVHMSLAKFPGVSTQSEGQGAGRRIQIIPARGSRPERGERTERGDRGDRSERGSERRGTAPAVAIKPNKSGIVSASRGPSDDQS
jgi:spoIIIJ-associated protein